MSYAAVADDVLGKTAFIAPLGGREADPEAGAARRGFFARAWSATKGMAKAAFTKENMKNMAFGAGTMFVAKSATVALAGACALSASGVALSVMGAGAVTAAGMSRYRELQAAKREGREASTFFSTANIWAMSTAAAAAAASVLPVGATASAFALGAVGAAGSSYHRQRREAESKGLAVDAFFSETNLRRMWDAAKFSLLGGGLIAAYQGGMFAPVAEAWASVAERLPEVHFNLSPIGAAYAYDYSSVEMDQMYGRGAAAATPAAHAEPAVTAPAHAPAPDVAVHHPVASAEKPAAPAVEKPTTLAQHDAPPAGAKPEPLHSGEKPKIWRDPGTGRVHAEYPSPVAHPEPSVSDVAPVPSGGGSALDRVQEMLAQQGGKPSRSMEMLLDRAAHSAQGQKDLAVAILWGKGGFTANPELARALLEDAVKQGNGQAVTSLQWMDKHGLGLSSAHAPAVTDGHAAAHPAAAPETHSPAAKTPPVSAKPAMAQAAVPAVEAAPRTVVIAPDLPPVPVAPDGVAISCVIGGDAETKLTVDCTAPEGKDYILPGERMSAVWRDRYPGVKIEMTNESGSPAHSWRAAAWAFYDNILELKKSFGEAVAWRGQHSQTAEKIAKATRKFFDFAFNNS